MGYESFSKMEESSNATQSKGITKRTKQAARQLTIINHLQLRFGPSGALLDFVREKVTVPSRQTETLHLRGRSCGQQHGRSVVIVHGRRIQSPGW